MKIKVTRVQRDEDVTIGRMDVDEQFECFTCEDVVRPDGAPKVFGKTAIPAGTYAVTITPSAHFKRDLPLLAKVPGFDGVRIHQGNTAADTEGCILVGAERKPKAVAGSAVAFQALFPKIQAALKGGQGVTLEIG